MTWTDGSSYDGEWVQGKITSGIIKFPNGDTYIGQFDDQTPPQPHGPGTMKQLDMGIEKGVWENGEIKHECQAPQKNIHFRIGDEKNIDKYEVILFHKIRHLDVLRFKISDCTF